MKHLLTVILLIVVIGATVSGCDGAHRYDARLVRADSLMRPDPDSALAIVQAVDRDSLTGEGDRAYRDLLLTQARYRCYVTATSDSDINRALAYYRTHSGEREKLTRAYIYKGAVMEELGHPDSAMLYYKTAEATATPTDYFNLGYTKMRIATLYQDQISQDSSAIIRFKDAIHYFKILNDTDYLISCYGDLGALCGMKYPDSTESYLSTAINLAEQFNSPKKYIYMSKMAGLYLFHHRDYRKTLTLATTIIKNGKDECEETQYFYYAALASLKLGLLDSAKRFLDMAPVPKDAVDSMLVNDVAAEIAKVEQDFKKYGATESLNKSLATDFRDKLKETELIKAEKEFDRKQAFKERNEAFHRNRGLLIFFIISSVLLFVFVLLNRHLLHRLSQHQQEKAVIKAELENALDTLSKEQAKHMNESSVSDLVGYRIEALTELYHSVRIKIEDDNIKRRKKIIPLSSLLQMLNEESGLLELKLSDSFWEKMKKSVDGELNGIVSFVDEKYQSLSVDDVRLFSLYCARISPQIIKMCMNFDHPKTASNYKRKLIKIKMGLDMSFDEFVEHYMNGDFS